MSGTGEIRSSLHELIRDLIDTQNIESRKELFRIDKLHAIIIYEMRLKGCDAITPQEIRKEYHRIHAHCLNPKTKVYELLFTRKCGI
jgi:hypothetical protein